ncbi:MAG TPA: DsbA family protein, partial [Alphaproteobacteria bacterium]|nr:DsbA family protein [Alphaproteobacteria bacterium]
MLVPLSLSNVQRHAVEGVFERYLDSHPELVGNAISQLDARQKAAVTERERAAIAAHADALFNDPDDLVLGNPNGDVTIVEFFDYRCPYCKRALPDIMQTLKSDGHIRLVLKEFPILGPDSQLAARAALASIKQGKYPAFHSAMLASTATLNMATIMSIAEANGIDTKRLQSDMKAPEIDALIRKNMQLAQGLKIEGTPAFIVGDKLVPGAVDQATLQDLVRSARSKG